ncbi:NAD(P)-dependent oxidoreductase [Algicella marina]|uniref:NAD-binding protein n=1 Tax=Algicella marina TaxID=2683284 RepID=A0A6P1SXB0_9RHOB|nr:NAD(P)-dependent oxidoreductase [Algicella marina]QHQ34300.1 NAD-binding protein [Algicella marina]
MEHIGVIGLGRMGSAIARRMQAKGHAVKGWTRSGKPVDGVESAESLQSLANTADTLILSLFDDAAVASVLDRLLLLDLAAKQIIDTSTVVPEILKSRATAFAGMGASVVDAPISGGPELVMAGKCGVFIGGDLKSATRAEAVLGSISDRIFHVGPLGAGLVMKVVNNGMIQTYFNGLAELMPLAREAGLPLETALRILSGGPAGMPMVADRIPKVLGEDTAVGFTNSAVFKDNDVFRRVVQSFGLASGSLSAFGAREPELRAAGLAEEDPAALIRWAYEHGGGEA